MNNSIFCHIHNHNEFSLLDAIGTAEDHVAYAKKLGFKYLGLTNHGNIDGLIKFQNECDEQGINPVLGCELYIVPNMNIKKKGYKSGHMTVLIKDISGWKTLCTLLTKANLEGLYYNRPRIGYKDILESDLSGLIILTGCAGSFLKLEGAKNFFDDLWNKIPEQIYFEIMPHDIEVQYEMNKLIITYLQDYKIPTVATNDCHYTYQDDDEIQEVLLAIQTKAKWNDENRFKFNFNGLHLRDSQEMLDAFEKQGQFSKRDIIIAMMNTSKIAKQCCGFRIPRQNISLPSATSKNNFSPDHNLKELTKEGRLKLIKSGKIYEIQVDEYTERIKEELNLIIEKNFSEYFLIVYDLIQWAKSKNIAIGPGRGSSGGSLIAYILGITDIDPIKYNLLFSRFIAEDRNDYPDIDIDFEDARRDEVIQYLKKKYGQWHTVGISTFSTMKARAALRDVARVFDADKDIDSFAKSIPYYDTEKYKITKYAKESQAGKIFSRKYPDIVRIAALLENQIKNNGQHPSGIIISKEDLRFSSRCNLATRNNTTVVNWDIEDCEYSGLMKLDILGLNTLTIIKKTLSDIKDNVILSNLEFNSKKVFHELSNGNTFGVFQLSGFAETEVIKQIKISSFDNIIACIALARPGPAKSGMTEEYIKRSQGGSWIKKHPIYEEITKDTYGVICYQEQVMQVINQVAGLPYSIADRIRKIIGKKRDPAEFEKYWAMFLEGCLKQKTMNKSEAQEFWEGLQAHAQYSFGKAHSVAYAMLAYYTAWLKLNYPTEYICAYLTHSGDKKIEKEKIIKEALRLGLKIVPPKLGLSDAFEWQHKDGKLFVPFVEVKNIGEETSKTIAGKRKRTSNIKQESFFDIDIDQKITKSTRDMLAKINAYNPNSPLPEDAKSLFEFSLTGNPNDIYPILKEITDFDEKSIKELLKGINIPGSIIKRKGTYRPVPKNCNKCSLRHECSGPVSSSQGIYNVAIVAEAAGREEDKEGRGLIGPAGTKILWPELKIYSLYRRYFHVGNICKCWPSKTKTPDKIHIDACLPYLIDELREIECRLILATGRIPLIAFTGKDSGITKKSGTTEWIENIGAWICWCVHPSAVLRNMAKNLKPFKEGIRNFAETFNKLRN